MAEGDDGFLARWSRRKAQVRDGRPVVAESMPLAAVPCAVPAPAAPAAAEGDAPADREAAAPAPPPLTMDDVARLTKDSDFSAFTAPHLDPQVRNAAMKKLFHGDPHFNVMDGLDIYIDDYNKPDPLPKSMLRQMVQARFLGLLDDEVEEQPHPDASAGPAAAPNPAPNEDADLQLQPDDAAGRQGDRPGPGADAGDERRDG